MVQTIESVNRFQGVLLSELTERFPNRIHLEIWKPPQVLALGARFKAIIQPSYWLFEIYHVDFLILKWVQSGTTQGQKLNVA